MATTTYVNSLEGYVRATNSRQELLEQRDQHEDHHRRQEQAEYANRRRQQMQDMYMTHVRPFMDDITSHDIRPGSVLPYNNEDALRPWTQVGPIQAQPVQTNDMYWHDDLVEPVDPVPSAPVVKKTTDFISFLRESSSSTSSATGGSTGGTEHKEVA